MEQNQNGGTQPGQFSGGQTFHAPQTDTWANGYAPGSANTPGANGMPPAQQVQAELEAQIRSFSASISDGFRYGFEGRGPELGGKAKNVGYAVLDAVNYGIEQGRQAADAARRQQTGTWQYSTTQTTTSWQTNPAGQRTGGWTGMPGQNHVQYAGSYGKPKGLFRRAAGTRFGVGLAQVITGGIFLFCFGLGGLICTGLGFLSAAVLITGLSLLAASMPFLWLTIAGVQNLSANSRMKAYDSALGMQESIPLEMLARAVGRSSADTVKDLKKMIRKGWLTAWLDENAGMLYVTQQAYAAAYQVQRAAQEAASEQAADQAEKEAQDATLTSMENFITVLGQQADTMADDAAAAEELRQMQATSSAILAWLKAHPESMPKARRLASYYIPTTLKLLHTYNDMKAQNTDNANSIRRDIAGMLHTLNTAFCNLHDTLLSDVALDVSGEIAALQGMLAQDGLSEDILNTNNSGNG